MNDENRFYRAKRISGMEISEIVRLSERAAEMRAQGQDVVGLTTGEPDFETPEHVVAAANAAAVAGQTKYPATMGSPALRGALAQQYGVDSAQVIVSTGAKQVLANAMLATLDLGDEVIIPAPYWTSYSDIVTLAGGTSVVVSCGMENGFKLGAEELEAAITERTRWVMLNAPSNPTGAIYTESEQAALAEVLTRHPQVMIVVDEIYEHLSYVPFVSFRDVAPELLDRMLVVNGVSKAYAMTGWRIGWGVGPTAMIRAMGAVQGQVTSGACSIAQAAALAAISGDQALLAERLAILRARRDMLVTGLNALPGVVCQPPDGAFYVFPDIRGAMAKHGFDSDAVFCAALLEQKGLAIVPGRAFGAPGHVRLSFAYSEDDLRAALARLTAFLRSDT